LFLIIFILGVLGWHKQFFMMVVLLRVLEDFKGVYVGSCFVFLFLFKQEELLVILAMSEALESNTSLQLLRFEVFV